MKQSKLVKIDLPQSVYKCWTVFNTTWDATDAVIEREAIKKMLEERWREPQQGTALTFSTKEHIMIAKWKEHQKDLMEHDPWKYLNGHSYFEYQV